MSLDLGYIAAKLEEWKEQITDEKNHLTLDYETYYDSAYSLRKKDMTYVNYVHDDRFKFQSVAFGWGRDGEIEYVEDKHVAEAVNDIFVPDNKIVMIGANLMFEGLVTRYRTEAVPAWYIDVLGLSRATRPHATFHSLEAVAKRLFPNNPEYWKGQGLSFVMGVYDLTADHHKVLKPYNIDDIVATRACAYKYLDYGFPVEELLVQDMLIKMATIPPFKANVPLLERTYMEAKIAQDDAIEGALEFMQETAKTSTELSPAFFVPTDDRDTSHFKTQKGYVAAYRLEFGGLPPIKKEEESQKFLSSNDKFAYYLRAAHGVAVGLKESPTPKDPDNETWALSKDDVQFQRMIAAHRDLDVLWQGRLFSKSNMAKTRAATLLNNAAKCDGWLAIVIKYAAAHTHRFGGGQKINPQNFGRGSNHRLSLESPDGYMVGVADSSNIESRMSAWFCDFEEKLDLFRTGGDPYNDQASAIFSEEIDRKGNPAHKIMGMVGKATELGCGYQMGKDRFQNFLNAGPLGMPPIFLEDVESLAHLENPYEFVVKAYRKKNYPIRNMWKQLESVIQDMTNKNTNYEMNGVRILYQQIQGPNGLSLHYPQLGRRRNNKGELQWSYKSSKGFVGLFGGKLLENIIQFLARCVVVEQMLWVAAHLTKYEGCRVAMQVHDEIISNILTEQADTIQQECEDIMKISPSWCADIPLDAEGGYAKNYSK